MAIPRMSKEQMLSALEMNRVYSAAVTPPYNYFVMLPDGVKALEISGRCTSLGLVNILRAAGVLILDSSPKSSDPEQPGVMWIGKLEPEQDTTVHGLMGAAILHYYADTESPVEEAEDLAQ